MHSVSSMKTAIINSLIEDLRVQRQEAGWSKDELDTIDEMVWSLIWFLTTSKYE